MQRHNFPNNYNSSFLSLRLFNKIKFKYYFELIYIQIFPQNLRLNKDVTRRIFHKGLSKHYLIIYFPKLFKIQFKVLLLVDFIIKFLTHLRRKLLFWHNYLPQKEVASFLVHKTQWENKTKKIILQLCCYF